MNKAVTKVNKGIEVIKRHFPQAMEEEWFQKKSIKRLIELHGFDMKRMIVATSVCSDEINRSMTDPDYPGLSRDRFQLGGLAGYPFTGITGLKAFASHIPDHGFAVIFYGPHIGVSSAGVVGKVCRHHQDHPTSSCGALQMMVSFIDERQKERRGGQGLEGGGSGGQVNISIHDPEDYQEMEIIRILMEHQPEILNAKIPLLKATELFYHVIDTRLTKLFERVKDSFSGTKVAWIGGITINTDYGEPDWFDVKRFDVQSYE